MTRFSRTRRPRDEPWSPPTFKAFVPLDSWYRAAGQALAGLILVSTKTFPQNRGFPSAITTSLATQLSDTAKIQSGQMLFLTWG